MERIMIKEISSGIRKMSTEDKLSDYKVGGRFPVSENYGIQTLGFSRMRAMHA